MNECRINEVLVYSLAFPSIFAQEINQFVFINIPIFCLQVSGSKKNRPLHFKYHHILMYGILVLYSVDPLVWLSRKSDLTMFTSSPK